MFPWTKPSEPLRFDRFMDSALHDPGQGYYTRRIRGVGRSGDFTTTATVSPALGKAIADWGARALAQEKCRNLIELGPGEGSLAVAVLKNLSWHRRLRTRMHLVETSKSLRKKQQILLGNQATWHTSVADALDACDGNACLYSNEFADAFPVRRFRKDGDQWEEHHLLPERELWKPVTELPESTLFHQTWPDRQIVEVHQSYHQWLSDMLPHWQRGRMLTIDYGARDKDLYHRQPNGSLRAYFHQQCLTGPEAWARPGHHDLTADINFSDLIEWPQPETRLVSLVPQAEFLAPYIDANNPADQFATHPAGSGAAFLYLDQCRKVARA